MAQTSAETAVGLFVNGLNCSRAILTTFWKACGLGPDMAKRLGRTLGGGISRMGRTCGAVNAAALVLGPAKDHEDEAKARKVAYAAVQELFGRFVDLHGTTECKSLLGVDLSTPDGLKKARDEKLFTTVCPEFVRDTANILEELLER